MGLDKRIEFLERDTGLLVGELPVDGGPMFALCPIAPVVFALGLGVLTLAAWRAHTLPRWITVIWLAAIVVGALGLGVAALDMLFVLAGLFFAVGFVGAGVYSLRSVRPRHSRRVVLMESGAGDEGYCGDPR